MTPAVNRVSLAPKLPGLLLAAGVTIVALLAAEAQRRTISYALLDPLVLGLLLGLVIRTRWKPDARFAPGIAFGAKQVLETAIVLIGFTLALGALVDAGFRLLAAVLLCVGLTLALGVTLGRLAGLPPRMGVLIGVGSAICGNSAIAAVAPVIRAKQQDIASAIAITAVLGVGVVLTLPLLIPLLALSDGEYGVVAGLSVYAVPQVLAATFPVSAGAGQVASLVKLTRVLLLGPMIALLALLYRDPAEERSGSLKVSTVLPWFVIGFAITVTLQSIGAVPDWLSDVAVQASRVLTAVAMAALGLSVDVRTVRETGGRATMTVLAVTLTLVVLAVLVTLSLDLP